MAENLIRAPWYPNPRFSYGRQDFIYLHSLAEDHPQVYHAARNKFFDTLANIDFNLEPQLDDLLSLAERERDKEDKMLNEIFGPNKGTPREDGARIRAFNDLYQNELIFARNLEKIKAVGEGSRQGRIDITAHFREYLKREIETWFKNNKTFDINQETLKQLTKNALYKAFLSKDKQYSKGTPEEEIKQSYLELAHLVEKMEQDDPFLEEVFDLYFGSSLDDLLKKTKQKTITVKDKKEVTALISKERGIHGNLQEQVLALVNNSLKQKGKMIITGDSKQKADLITLYEATFELPEELFAGVEIGESVRERFIQRYQHFYDTLQEQRGNIVEISAKNYNLTSDYFKEQGGFTAQSGVSIKNLEKMLNAYKYDKKRTDDLIFALTNIGPDTLGQGTEIVTHSLSLLIGYFLFDDIDMDIGLDVNAIHLFNLDGIYMPLSCFLFAAYDTLKDMSTLNKSMISVNYAPSSIEYKKAEPGNLCKELWEQMADKKQAKTN